MARDNFTQKTVDMLGKRVGYLCSKPNCRKPTVGANQVADKSTIIGVAAHITAASVGGPRYDDSLTTDQRKHIDNGIWLCNNCSTFIDKDPQNFPVELLRTWKENAEEESMLRLSGIITNSKQNIPFLEADLINTTRLRMHNGFSARNPYRIENGARIFDMSNKPIIHWKLIWKFRFIIHNNSTSPAFNVKVENLGEEEFTQVDSLPKINNIPPYQNIDLNASYEVLKESTGQNADSVLNTPIPKDFNKLKLKLTYFDEERVSHQTIVEFKNGEIVSTLL